MQVQLIHNYLLLKLSLILLLLLVPTQADNFDSIFSIHTERTPYCPPNYSPDANYVGCCWGDYQTITSAKGPDGALSPGCCYQAETCTGAPPIMYDWTTNRLGQLEVITPGANAATTSASPPKPPTKTPNIPQDTPPPSAANPGSSPTGSTLTGIQNSNPTGGSSSPSPSSQSSGGGLSPGAIAGIVVSIACSIISLIFGIWFRFYKLKRKERKEKMQQALAQTQRQDSWKEPSSPVLQTPPPPPPPAATVRGGQYGWPGEG